MFKGSQRIADASCYMVAPSDLVKKHREGWLHDDLWMHNVRCGAGDTLVNSDSESENLIAADGGEVRIFVLFQCKAVLVIVTVTLEFAFVILSMSPNASFRDQPKHEHRISFRSLPLQLRRLRSLPPLLLPLAELECFILSVKVCELCKHSFQELWRICAFSRAFRPSYAQAETQSSVRSIFPMVVWSQLLLFQYLERSTLVWRHEIRACATLAPERSSLWAYQSFRSASCSTLFDSGFQS